MPLPSLYINEWEGSAQPTVFLFLGPCIDDPKTEMLTGNLSALAPILEVEQVNFD